MGFLKDIGPMELGIILLIVVMVFGVGKLPQVASSIGKSIREFKKATNGPSEEEEEKPVRRVKRTTRRAASAADA